MRSILQAGDREMLIDAVRVEMSHHIRSSGLHAALLDLGSIFLWITGCPIKIRKSNDGVDVAFRRRQIPPTATGSWNGQD